MSTWRSIMRPDLLGFEGYGAASPGRGLVRLHANESPFDPAGRTDGLNRYPPPAPGELITALADFYARRPDQVLPVRGSDDAIDLLVRAFCRAGRDSVVVCPPTFGIYAVAARLQNAGVIEVPLVVEDGFRLDVEGLQLACTPDVRLVFLCSPNNPTGNLAAADDIRRLADALAGRAVLVVDEAYVEFAKCGSVAAWIDEVANLVVLRTLSKAFALAGIRCGALLARADLVAQLRCLLPPYPLSAHTVETACRQLREPALGRMRRRIAEIRDERDRVAARLRSHPGIRRVWPSQANFLLVEPRDGSHRWTEACRQGGVLVRRFADRNGLGDAVRLTVGSRADNERLLTILGTLEVSRSA